MVPRTVRVTVGGDDLNAELWLPASVPAPTLLMRTPYGARDAQRSLYADPAWYADHGYAVVIQDVRGRGASKGRFDPFRSEAADGASTIAWIAAQDWCVGDVGMYGMSYAGATQLLAASTQPSALRAIAPAMTASDLTHDWFHDGGVPSLSLVLLWAAVLGIEGSRRAGDAASRTALEQLCASPAELFDRWGRMPADELLGPAQRSTPFLRDWAEHGIDDPFWDRLIGRDLPDRIDVPALHVGGWFDVLLGGTLRTYADLRARGAAPQHLVVGPWAHEPWSRFVGDRDLGPEASSPVDEVQLEWFDHWLRGRPLTQPPVRVFELGAGRWRAEDAWPPPATRAVRLYLYGDGSVRSAPRPGQLRPGPPDGEEPRDVFVHDPSALVPTIGGRGCSVDNGSIVGPRDRRAIEGREDVLLYETDALADGCTIAGEVRSQLHVAFSGPSADFVVALVHVEPDGRATGLADGIVRVTGDGSCAGIDAHATRLSMGVLRVEFPAGHLCAAVRAGDRLRVEVAGSSHPRWAPAGDGARADGADPIGSTGETRTIFHDAGRPSFVDVPVIGGAIAFGR